MHLEPGQRILLVSPEAWGPAKVSKHHYAQALVDRGCEVYFLDPYGPGRSWSVTRDPGGVQVVHAPPMPRGTRFLPGAVRAFLDDRRMERLADLCGGSFDLCWNFDLYRFRDLRDRTHARVRMLHVMDLPLPDDLAGPARSADAVLFISPRMAEHLPPSAPPHLHVPHGLALPQVEPVPPRDLRGGVRIAYLGNLAQRFLDLEGLARVAKADPRIVLYLVGPYGGNLTTGKRAPDPRWDALRKLPNVVHVGPIPSEQVQGWLAAMDILLVAYDTLRFPRETAHPHKVIEYLYSGRLVLATHMADMTDLEDLLVMLGPGVPIDAGIPEVIDRLHELNTPEAGERRRRFALTLRYVEHVDRIAGFLERVGP